MNTLLLLLTLLVTQESSGFPYPEFTMKCYPEMVMPGDTLYIKIIAKNPYDELIYISDEFLSTEGDIRTHLRDSENQKQPLLFESPDLSVAARGLCYTEIKPGDSRIIGALTINVPPLEDMKEPFWEKHWKNLPTSDVKLSLCVTVTSSAATKNGDISRYKAYENLPFTFETPIVLKQRPEKEMTLIQQWYELQVNEWQASFPATQKYRKAGTTGHKTTKPKNTVVKDEKVSHWFFVRIGNRYPNYPVAPETWQEWQKLEESLTPSTMRDEIRLSRILIQYCDTEDDAVLKELKDWFDTMNEIQRTVMAKSLRNLAMESWELRDRTMGNYYSGTIFKLLPPFRELYKAIREYDVAPIPWWSVTHLRENLGLIE